MIYQLNILFWSCLQQCEYGSVVLWYVYGARAKAGLGCGCSREPGFYDDSNQ